MGARFVLALLLAVAAAPLVESATSAVDLVAVRNVVYNRAIALFLNTCQYCVTGPALDLDRHGEEGAPPGPLPPGQYYFEALAPSGCQQESATAVLSPGDGAWSVPVLVWRDHAIVYPLDPWRLMGQIQDYSGTARPIPFDMVCHGGRLLSLDLLVLPQGNLGEEVTQSIAVEGTTDVDVFPGSV